MINFRKILIFLVSINIIVLSWWLILIFNTFPKKYYFTNLVSSKHNSAIIVLTGGKGRIQKGIDLYKNDHGTFLFISGVFHDSELEIKQQIERQVFNNSCCVVYDKNARNTFENAFEVKNWLVHNPEIDNLILVSSYYHLPISFIIFNNIIGEKKIFLSPAEYKLKVNNNLFFHIKLIFLEYVKVIYTIISLI